MSGSGLYSDYGLDDNEDEHGFWSVSDDEVEATERDAGGADISEAVYDAKNMHPANRRNGIPSHLKTESGAMILPDGKIASEKPIPELFRDIEASQIDRTFGTFAAVLRNGRVVTGGDARNGGVIPDDVQGELMNQKVQKISSTYFAYAALLGNSRVVTWGNARWGGNSSAVQDELKGQTVKHIYSSRYAFVALLGNGRVVVWGRTVWRERIKRVIQLPLGRTVIDVVGNSVILDDWRALSISPRSPSILDSLTYDRFIEKRIYRKTLGNASFNTHPSTGSRRQVLQDTRMLQHIMSFLTPGEVTDFQGVQPGTNTRLN